MKIFHNGLVGRDRKWFGWKSSLIYFVMIVLVVACKKDAVSKSPPSDAERQQQLVGKWLLLTNSLREPTFESTVTVSSNGAYVADVRDAGRKHWHLEGTWRIDGSLLIDTILKDGNTNANLPFVCREKILRFDENELVTRWEMDPSNFVDSVFEKDNGN